MSRITGTRNQSRKNQGFERRFSSFSQLYLWRAIRYHFHEESHRASNQPRLGQAFANESSGL